MDTFNVCDSNVLYRPLTPHNCSAKGAALTVSIIEVLATPAPSMEYFAVTVTAQDDPACSCRLDHDTDAGPADIVDDAVSVIVRCCSHVDVSHDTDPDTVRSSDDGVMDACTVPRGSRLSDTSRDTDGPGDIAGLVSPTIIRSNGVTT